MINKELKKLSRRELVDIIYQLKRNEQQLHEEIDSLKKELEDKRITLAEAGSIAEASMSVANVFAAAQTSADMYLSEIATLKEETERECAKKIEEADEKVKIILASGQKKCLKLNLRYKLEYQKLQRLQEEIKQLEESKKTD